MMFLMTLTATELRGALRYFMPCQTVEAQTSTLHNVKSFLGG